MIVDSSALVAILFDEVNAPVFAQALSTSPISRICAGSLVEASIVVDGHRNTFLSSRLDELVSLHSIHVEPVTERQAGIARQAYRDFGRGSGHPASLDFGDCLSYALARDLGEPLLFKGDGFALTDVRNALAHA